jgi:hypothetical protein
MMPRTSRSIAVLLLAALVAGGGASLGAAAVSAEPTGVGVHSSTVPCGYPPGSCLVLYNRSGYKHGQYVHYRTSVHSFNPHGRVRIRITGPHGYHRTFQLHHANSRGTVFGLLKITKRLRLGVYTMTLRGYKHGRVQIIKGHYRVRR